MTDDIDSPLWQVVRNDRGRFSLWPVSLTLPRGWRADGPPTDRGDALDEVGRRWHDDRPAGVGGAR